MSTSTTRERLLRVLRPASRHYYRDPAGYWDARHRKNGKSLGGPGCATLDEAGNRRDYETKWDHLRPLLEAEREAGAVRLLDAGCGSGWFTALASGLGFADLDAADFSTTAAELAQRKVPGSRVSACALDEIESDDGYDVVMSIDVLFHVVDDTVWARSVRNLARLTRPRGALVIQDCVHDGGGAPALHVRHRTLAGYLSLLPGWELEVHDTYELQEERVLKDLLLFRSPER